MKDPIYKENDDTTPLQAELILNDIQKANGQLLYLFKRLQIENAELKSKLHWMQEAEYSREMREMEGSARDGDVYL